MLEAIAISVLLLSGLLSVTELAEVKFVKVAIEVTAPEAEAMSLRRTSGMYCEKRKTCLNQGALETVKLDISNRLEFVISWPRPLRMTSVMYCEKTAQ